MGIDLRAELAAMRVVHSNDAQRGPIQDHLALILAHHREAVLCREYGPLVAHQVSERFSHRWIQAPCVATHSSRQIRLPDRRRLDAHPAMLDRGD